MIFFPHPHFHSQFLSLFCLTQNFKIGTSKKRKFIQKGNKIEKKVKGNDKREETTKEILKRGKAIKGVAASLKKTKYCKASWFVDLMNTVIPWWGAQVNSLFDFGLFNEVNRQLFMKSYWKETNKHKKNLILKKISPRKNRRVFLMNIEFCMNKIIK